MDSHPTTLSTANDLATRSSHACLVQGRCGMRNKILTLTRNSIPYIKELRPLTKSIAGAIIMQQLDYWFNTSPNGFYKFLEPCQHDKCREGDSWCEEIGCTPDEFRAAFDKIGVRYKSKTEYSAAGETKSKGMLYCSFFDKVKGETWYFRNHDLVDDLLDEIISREPVKASPGNGKSHLPEMEKAIHRDWIQLLEMEKTSPVFGKSQTEFNREHTENTQRTTTNMHPVVVASLVSDVAVGITVAEAERLSCHFPEDRIRKHLSASHWKNKQNPPGALVTAIREDWPVKQFLPRPNRRERTENIRPPQQGDPPPDLKAYLKPKNKIIL